jgi:hypothetical protein
MILNLLITVLAPFHFVEFRVSHTQSLRPNLLQIKEVAAEEQEENIENHVKHTEDAKIIPHYD